MFTSLSVMKSDGSKNGEPPVKKTCRRKTIALGLGLATALATSSSIAAEPPNPKDLTQGKWELQLAKSKFCKAAPKKSTREIFDAGWGLISVHWTGIDSEGKPMDIRYVWRYDGQKYPAEITKPADEAITWKLVNPSRVEFVHWSKNDKITQKLLRTVSPDGQTMTQTTKNTGEECEDVQVFARQ